MRTRVKICCISSIEEAQLAIAAGADALGLVGEMPSGPGVIDDQMASAIAAAVPPAIGTFLLTQRTEADAIADHVHACCTNAVQIVNHIAVDEHRRIATLLPAAVRRVQVIHVEGSDAVDLIKSYVPHVHAFLLDSGRPSADVPELGGTGRAHDWDISRQCVEASAKPVFLAGGLNAENVGDAIARVRPYGVDLCTGVRVDNRLCPDRLTQFMTAVAQASEL